MESSVAVFLLLCNGTFFSGDNAAISSPRSFWPRDSTPIRDWSGPAAGLGPPPQLLFGLGGRGGGDIQPQSQPHQKIGW
jgi:hypothetical protein